MAPLVQHANRLQRHASPLMRLYDETLGLLEEARDYAVAETRTNSPGDSAEPRFGLDRLTASCESMRLTARLTQVMAWVLTQRAVQEGELDRQSALAEDYRLGGHDVCADTSARGDQGVSFRLGNLLDRSHSLYLRVERMERAALARAGLVEH